MLGAPDAQELAAFYRRLLGWAARKDEPGWVALSAPDGGAGLSFQTETPFRGTALRAREQPRVKEGWGACHGRGGYLVSWA